MQKSIINNKNDKNLDEKLEKGFLNVNVKALGLDLDDESIYMSKEEMREKRRSLVLKK